MIHRFFVWLFFALLSVFSGNAFPRERIREPKHNSRREKRIVEAQTRRQRDYAVNSKTSKQYSMMPMPRKRRK
uniref:Secreted protein n=1 Tax=Ascaris lumbricoides TaxID=6252 RepID=A0A0M3I5R7_ASCLU